MTPQVELEGHRFFFRETLRFRKRVSARTSCECGGWSFVVWGRHADLVMRVRADHLRHVSAVWSTS